MYRSANLWSCAMRYGRNDERRILFLRRHYPDQVQGTGGSCIPLHLSRTCVQRPCIRFVLRSPYFISPRGDCQGRGVPLLSLHSSLFPLPSICGARRPRHARGTAQQEWGRGGLRPPARLASVSVSVILLAPFVILRPQAEESVFSVLFPNRKAEGRGMRILRPYGLRMTGRGRGPSCVGARRRRGKVRTAHPGLTARSRFAPLPLLSPEKRCALSRGP